MGEFLSCGDVEFGAFPCGDFDVHIARGGSLADDNRIWKGAEGGVVLMLVNKTAWVGGVRMEIR